MPYVETSPEGKATIEVAEIIVEHITDVAVACKKDIVFDDDEVPLCSIVFHFQVMIDALCVGASDGFVSVVNAQRSRCTSWHDVRYRHVAIFEVPHGSFTRVQPRRMNDKVDGGHSS